MYVNLSVLCVCASVHIHLCVSLQLFNVIFVLRSFVLLIVILYSGVDDVCVNVLLIYYFVLFVLLLFIFLFILIYCQAQ